MKRAIGFLAATLLLTGCGDDATGNNDTDPTPDAPTAPSLTAPEADVQVSSPLVVSGTGEASATVTVSLAAGTTEVATESIAVGEDGTFSINLAYTGQEAGGELSVAVTQTNAGGTSPATTLRVYEFVPSPSLTAPVANAMAFSPVVVMGTGSAGATIDAEILEGSTSLGTAVGAVDSQGDFSLALAYTNAASTTALTLRLSQTANGQASSSIETTLTQATLRTLSGTVEQNSGSMEGILVQVRLYDASDKVVDPLQTQNLNVPNSTNVTGAAYSFEVADGTYYLRAFRDSFGPNGSSVDGYPTLGFDAQETATQVVVNGADATGNVLTLDDVTQTDRFDGFNAFTYNETAEPEPPRYSVNNEDREGEGLCRGYSLRLSGERQGNDQNLSAPQAKLSNNTIVTLLDDGGCGSAVHDNTALSFDDDPGDGRYSYGMLDPHSSLVGDVIFFFRNTSTDHIHEQADNLGSIAKLDRGLVLTSPTGAAANTNLTPTLTWNSVVGASHYRVDVTNNSSGGGGGGYSNSGDMRSVNTTSYTVGGGFPVPDDQSLRVEIVAYDADPSMGDFDARADGVENYFLTDVDGADSIIVSGSLTNNSGQTGGYVIVAGQDEDRDIQGTVQRDATATDYTVTVFTDAGCPSPSDPEGFVSIKLDVAGTKEIRGGGDPLVRTLTEQTFCAALTNADATFNPGAAVVSPESGATAVGATPMFTWVDYATSYQAAAGAPLPLTAWSYIFYAASEVGDGFPDVIWGLPNTTTSFDMASPPTDRVDVVPLGNAPQTSAADLGADTAWEWGVIVIECDYNDSAYQTCLMSVLGDNGQGYAESPQTQFSTQ